MPRRTLRLIPVSAAAAITVALIGALAFGQGGSAAPTIPRDDTAACLACHSEAQGALPAVNAAALAAGPHHDLKCQDCHASMTGAPHTPEMLAQKAACGNCHADEQTAYETSVHARPDKVPGDHPTCISCHGGGNPHTVRPISAWRRRDLVALCAHCHEQKARMGRYGVDPNAVPSYYNSFHGKALVNFGMTNVAICVTCHGNHDVLSPSDPHAPTYRTNAAKVCGRPGCHPGAKMNFAMSGANHLRLKVDESLALRLILYFFRGLLTIVALMMVGAVGLDLRLKVFSRKRVPACGRPVAVLIALSYLGLVIGFLLAAADAPHSGWAFLAAVIVMAVAFVVYYFFTPIRDHRAAAANGLRFPRLTLALRLQHILLLTSFTLLAATGLPLRFSYIPYMQAFYMGIGGPSVARIIHRVAGCGLIGAWVWHVGWLLVRWKREGWSLKSWTMFPTWKDLSDFLATVKLYLGIGSDVPQYERFQFREKMDYFAEYWGMPVMVITGLILWAPVYWGNRLPEIGLSVAIIAHGYEATLAFIAIVTWHIYNAHFNPDCFPGQRVWFSGTLTHEEMERDHGLELQRIEEAGNTGESPEKPQEPKAPWDPR